MHTHTWLGRLTTLYCKLFKVKSFVIFVYQLVTMKLSSEIVIMPPCNRVWSHKTSVQPWMFSSELQFISTTTNLFYLKWFVYICNIQYTMHAPHHIASVFIHNLHICTYICTPISTHTLTATHTYTPGSYISMDSSGYLLYSN